MKQRDVFLKSEGDAWFKRNKKAVSEHKLPEDDPILCELIEISTTNNGKLKILEIGCGDGTRLNWLQENLQAECYGLDPSLQAVQVACEKGVVAQLGTADKLPFKNKSFDIVIFGFCLYLCDREDLFLISQEADRVLREPGWMIIMDFYSPTPSVQTYHHFEGLLSYKMDYRQLFTWHPNYECLTHKVRHHVDNAYTELTQEWVSTSVLLKSVKG